jgi:hypothetical protein
MPLSGTEGQEMLFEKGFPPQAISQNSKEGEYTLGTLCPNKEAAGNSLPCIIRLNEPVPRTCMEHENLSCQNDKDERRGDAWLPTIINESATDAFVSVVDL